MSNRILDYPEATEITSNDYILLDNEGTGAKCIKASALNINMDNYTIKEASGAIASFEDGEDLPLAFMGAYITAIQDLHGYDYPCVGGAGKNKLNLDFTNDTDSFSGLTFTHTDSTFKLKGTVSGSSYYIFNLTLPPNVDLNTDYTLSAIATGTVERCLAGVYFKNGNTDVEIIRIDISNTTPKETKQISAQFDNALFVFEGLQSGSYFDCEVKIQLEKGSSATSFAPYSNICPISGWDECNVTRCGKNLIPYVELGVLNQTDGSEEDNNDNKRTGFIRTLPNTRYTISGLDGSGISIRIFEYKKDKNYIKNYVSSNITNSVTIQTGEEVGYIRFQGNKNIFTSNVTQCEKGTTSSAYEPYNGQTYTIDLNGTRYGGTLDVVSGVMTVDRAEVDLGTLDWQYSSIAKKFYASATALGVKATDVSTPFNAISSALIAKSYNEIEAKTVDYAIAINPNATQLFARYSSITSASDFITAMNGVQLVYELATPLTYQLTKQQTRSLVGVNNIFADTGDSVVDYRKLWVMPEM